MNQVKIGKFIAKCRKGQRLTQVELAEKLDITNRAVSKWETGRSLPDSSIMLDLCKILNINVNELLSGQYIREENYSDIAEQNLINMFSVLNKKKTYIILRLLAGILLGSGTVIFNSIPSIVELTTTQNITIRGIGLLIFICATILTILVDKMIKNKWP